MTRILATKLLEEVNDATDGRRLRLTPFEEYMLLDDRAGWPMTFWIRLQFREPLPSDRLSQALDAVSGQHPLLSARVVFDAHRRPYWIPSDAKSTVRTFDSVESADTLPDAAPFDLTVEPPIRIWKSSDEKSPVVWLEIHHAACDGVGAFRAVDDILKKCQCETASTSVPEVDSNWDRVAKRHRSDNLSRLRDRLGQWAWMLWRIACYGLTTPASLDELHLPRGNCGEKPGISLPPAEYRIHSLGSVDVFRQVAQRENCTINDIVLRDLFCALRDLFLRRSSTKKHRLRLFVPMNLRGNPWNACAVCNVVGMLHIDRVVGPDSDETVSLPELTRDMKIYRRYQLGRAFVVPLEIATVLFGSPRLLISPSRCATTSVLTNLGMPLAESDLAATDGCLQVGSNVLEAADLLPPIRTMTPACFGLLSYAGELRLSFRFQREAFSHEDADFLFARFIERLRRSVQSSPGDNA